MNPCPCGYYGDDRHPCTCSMSSIQRYQKRISGPLMDRIDIHLEVQRVPYQKLTALEGGETLCQHPQRASKRRAHASRNASPARRSPDLLANGDMGPAEVQTFCKLDDAGSNLMRAAVKQMDLSARAYHRVLKLARTIADLAGEENIQSQHLAEALQYRPRGVG